MIRAARNVIALVLGVLIAIAAFVILFPPVAS